MSKTTGFRTVLLAAGVAALATAGALLYRQHLVEGFLLAFAGLSAISLSETDIDYAAPRQARSFIASLAGRVQISTFGKICDMASYLCLAAALISWVALR